jgi:hypothetical protein
MKHQSLPALPWAHRRLQALAFTLFVSTVSASGATLYVATTGLDDASCGIHLTTACRTIQYTITNRSIAGDTIRIDSGTYFEILTINKNLNLVGTGTLTTIVDGQRKGTVVTNSATTRIAQLTIEGGHGTTNVIRNLAGGVINTGTLRLEETEVTENTALVGFPNLSGTAGGIVNAGTLYLISSRVDGNSASGGCITAGGIANFINGRLLTEDSFIFENASSGSSSAECGGPGSVPAAGGIINNQGIFVASTTTIDQNSITNNGPFELTQSTVSNTTISDLAQLYVVNSTLYQAPVSIDYQPPFFAGVLNISSSTLYSTTLPSINLQPPWTSTIQNSILAGNPSGDCSGDFISGGYNLIENSTGCGVLLPNNDLVNVSPNLGSFGGHGGPTRTINLLPGSPAISGGNPAGCTDPFGNVLIVDQRNDPRPDPSVGRCDIGSVQD